MKKPPSKVAQKYSNCFSPWAAKTAPKKEFMFQNVAYRPTVYKTGVWAIHVDITCQGHADQRVGPPPEGVL